MTTPEIQVADMITVSVKTVYETTFRFVKYSHIEFSIQIHEILNLLSILALAFMVT